VSINLEEIVERAVPLSQGHYLAVRAEDFTALVAEVEHLRGERALDNDALARAWDEGRDMERAAVVAWLRREIAKCGCDDDTAACVERGEHRRKEEP
jgi:hypothetical protein